jgi:hypothetical protein
MDFSPISHDFAMFEHEPRHPTEPVREALNVDVSPLQMLKRPRVVVTPGRFDGARSHTT